MSDKSNSLTSIGLAVPQAEHKQVAENEDVRLWQKTIPPNSEQTE